MKFSIKFIYTKLSAGVKYRSVSSVTANLYIRV